MCTSYCNGTLNRQAEGYCLPFQSSCYRCIKHKLHSAVSICCELNVFACCVTVRPTLSGSRYVSLTVNSGETLSFTNFDVIGGYPTPKVTWYKEDAEIPSGAPSSATADDAGRYKVVAENEAGSDVHYVDVDVSIAGNSCFI